MKISAEEEPLSSDEMVIFYRKLKRSILILNENGGSFVVDKDEKGYRKKITAVRFLKNYLLAVSVSQNIHVLDEAIP